MTEDEYTPTTAEIRATSCPTPETEAMFDRWLNSELAKAWDAAADRLALWERQYDDPAYAPSLRDENPYRAEGK